MTSPHIKVSVSTNATYRCVTWSTGGRLTTPYMIAGSKRQKEALGYPPLVDDPVDGGDWRSMVWHHIVPSNTILLSLMLCPPHNLNLHVMPFSSYLYPLINDFFLLFCRVLWGWIFWNFSPCKHQTLVVKAWFGGTQKYWAFVRGAQG